MNLPMRDTELWVDWGVAIASAPPTGLGGRALATTTKNTIVNLETFQMKKALSLDSLHVTC